MDFEKIASQLYGLPLDEFVTARDQHVAEARKSKDRDLANKLKALTKPTLGAWAVNQMVRRHGKLVDGLMQIGDGMRDAQQHLDGDRLRDYSHQRRQRMAELATELGSLGVSDAAEQEALDTFGAAVAESSLAEQVRAGRVTRSLQHTGFGGLAEMLAAAQSVETAEVTAEPEPEPEPEPQLEPEPTFDAEAAKSPELANHSELLAVPQPVSVPKPEEKRLRYRLESAREGLAEARADAQLAQERVEIARERLQVAKEKLKSAEALLRKAEVECDEIQELLDEL